MGMAIVEAGCVGGQFGDTGTPTGTGSPRGTGGSSSTGSGGASSSGTGGTSAGTGGTSAGTGGTSAGTGGTTAGTGGTTDGTGGASAGTGGTSDGTGGTSAGTGGATAGTGGASAGMGGAGGAVVVAPDPFTVAPTCSSKKTWTGGNEGSSSMNPGKACISCHKSSGGEAPGYAIAGTLYPTAHEPDLCNGTNGTTGAQIVIVGADGKTLTLTPNGVGNFYSSTTVKLPYQAKVVYMGRERAMVETQTSGDCNSCHTQNGANNAPGRILQP